MNHALRRVSLVVLGMFLLLLLNVNYVQAFEPSYLAGQRGNARVFAEQFQYQRGSIITADNKTVAASVHVKGIYSYQRVYPDPLVYAPVTGYDSIYSTTGIEQTEDKYLAGTAPQLTVHNLIDLVTGKPRRGATVQLTVNSVAQAAAYDALKATGLPSAAVAIQPSTGAILALASYPTFNPNKYATFDGTQLRNIDNRYRNSPQQPLLNRAIDQTFPPGSTFKIVTSSTAFSTGSYNPDTPVYAPTNLKLPNTSNQLINYDNLPCNNGSNPSGTGKVPLIYAFTVSCNTVFGNLGMHLGDNALRAQAEKFGMNNPNLKIPLPVAQSNYPPIPNNDPALTAYSAIGQYNDTVTPLQEAMFSAAIANNGNLMTPYLVQRVTAPDLTPLVTAQPTSLSQAVTPSVAAQVARMMVSVVQQPYGTAHSVVTSMTNYTVAAKTGTAQNGPNNTGLDDAVFTCYAPVTNPQIAIGVIVKGGGLGADASAPIAVKILQAYLSSLARR
ncbi:MAG TPA: penicillin-binding transpeptidase domain-containing protein [Streptosporangiaceae bacterium]|nr:penicillin-binding transpeptidase domain-containing protein [Streptosporangiaceae bacterium]